MKNKLLSVCLMSVAFVIGVFGSAIIRTSNTTTAIAEAQTTNVKVVELHTTLPYITETTIRDNFSDVVGNCNNEGSETIGKSMTKYSFFVSTTNQETGDVVETDITKNELDITGGYFATASVDYDGQEFNFWVEKKTGTRKNIFSSWNWSESEPVAGASGSFKVALYSDITLKVDTDDVDTGETPVVAINDLDLVGSTYKAYYGADASISIERINDYNVFVNDTLFEGDSYPINDITENATYNVRYEKSTNSKVIIDTTSLTGVTLEVNGTKINSRNSTIVVSAGSEVSIVAKPDNEHLISSVTCNGIALDNASNYPNYSATFEAGIREEYNIVVNSYTATNTISCAGDIGKVKYGIKTQSLNSTLPRDTEVTVVLEPADNQYFVSYSINVQDTQIKCVNGKVEISFTTSVGENYVVEYTTDTMFNLTPDNVNINVYDVMLMIDGDETAKNEIYSTLLYDAFNANFDINMADVRFEYIAGTYVLDMKETFTIIPDSIYNYGLPKYIDIDLYYSIDSTNPALLTKSDIVEYIYNYLNERYGSIPLIGNYITIDNLDSVLDAQMIEGVIASMHLFGSTGNETVKLIYAGNDDYQALEMECEILATDLREEITFDINDEVTVTYGGYLNNDAIMNLILADRKGVINLEGNSISGLNERLMLSANMVGKDVGTHTISLIFPDSDFYYKGNSIEISVTIEKADVKVDVANNILNFATTSNGSIVKGDIVTINPIVEIANKNVDNIYFVMGLDVVEGEVVVNIDLTNIKSYDSDIEQSIIDTAIKTALKLADQENDGLTLVEFVDFALNLSTIMGFDGIGIDNTYIDKLTELLGQANETVSLRLKVVYGDTNIVPQNPGVYLVGVVTTDSNYNIAGDAGYLVITPDIISIKFADDTNNNNLKKFDYDGTPKQMVAEAYDFDNQIAEGTMVYYYVGLQLDGTFYASSSAPIHAGSYSVFVLFSNAKDGGLPSQVGVGVGAMVIVPAGNVEISIEDKVVCGDGQEHNIDYVVEEGALNITIIRNGNQLNIILPESWNINKYDGVVLNLKEIGNIIGIMNQFLPDSYLVDLQTKIENIVEKYDIQSIVVNQTLPVEIGEYEISIIAFNFDNEITLATANLTIKAHNEIYHAGKAPTCTEFGWNEYYTCSDCDYTSYETIDALGHNAVVDNAVKPTCTLTGLTQGTHCVACGEIFVAQEIVDALGHNASDWEVVEEATCTAKGTSQKVCTVCGEQLETKEIAMISHNMELTNTTLPTCTVAGVKEYTCENCTHKEYEAIAALGHNAVVDSALKPTCTLTGLTAGSHCETCGEVFVDQEVVDALGHVSGDWTLVQEATCTVKGLEHKTCTVCNEVLDTKEIAMISHNMELTNTTLSTCTVAGVKEYTCENCTHKEYEAIAALGHNAVVDSALKPTCTLTGLTAGSHCETCGEVLVSQEVVDALGHNVSDWEVVEEATCTTKGIAQKVCTVCNQQLDTKELEMIEHAMGDWYVETHATATTDGRYERVCSECNHKEHKTIEAYGDKNVGNVEITDSENGKVSIDSETIENTIKDIVESGKNEIIISTNSNSTELNSVEMETSSLQQIVDANTSLTIQTNNVNATFSVEALNSIVSATNGSDNIEFNLQLIETNQLNNAQQNALSELKVAGVISAEILYGGNVISSFGNGTVQVGIPFVVEAGKNASDYKIIYISDNGAIEQLDTIYTNGQLVVELNHFSEYVIVDTFEAGNNTDTSNTTNTNNNSILIILISILSVIALLTVIGTVVFVKKESRR